MRLILFIMISVAMPLTSLGFQVEEEKEIEDESSTYCPVDVPASPVGGMAAFNKYIRDNIRYPAGDVQGRVFVEFIVNDNGTIASVKLKKGLHPDFDKEALRLITNMPAWTPAKQGAKFVKQRFVLPVKFDAL